jgi:hypothetical protein
MVYPVIFSSVGGRGMGEHLCVSMLIRRGIYPISSLKYDMRELRAPVLIYESYDAK